MLLMLILSSSATSSDSVSSALGLRTWMMGVLGGRPLRPRPRPSPLVADAVVIVAVVELELVVVVVVVVVEDDEEAEVLMHGGLFFSSPGVMTR